jgi:hypothetical protein
MRAVVLMLMLVGCGGREVPATSTEHGYVHGMLVFGERTTYFSHLPLFHPPHDYQIVLAVDLAGDAAARRVADQGATGERLYTFAPAPFVLDRAGEPGFEIRGDLVHGHFERGGTPLVTGVTATVARVVHFRRLEPSAADESLTYLLVGAPDEAYLVHHLTAAPDFDQVLSVRGALAVDAEALAAGLLVRFPGHAAEPLIAGEQVDADGLAIEVGDELYLERDELAR